MGDSSHAVVSGGTRGQSLEDSYGEEGKTANMGRRGKRRQFRSQSHNPQNKNFLNCDEKISYDIHKRIQQNVGSHLFTSDNLKMGNRKDGSNVIIDMSKQKLKELDVNEAIHAVIQGFLEGNPSQVYPELINSVDSKSEMEPRNLVSTTITLVEECLRFALSHEVFDGVYVSRLRKNNEILKRSSLIDSFENEPGIGFRLSLNQKLNDIEGNRRKQPSPKRESVRKQKPVRKASSEDHNATVEHLISDLVNSEFNGEKIDDFLMSYRFFTSSHLLLKNLKLAFEATEMPFFDSEEENLRVQLNILSVLIRWTCRDEYSLDPEIFGECEILEEILHFAKSKASRKNLDAVVHLSILQVIAHVTGTVEYITEGESSEDEGKDGGKGEKIEPVLGKQNRSASAVSARLGDMEEISLRSFVVSVEVIVNPEHLKKKENFVDYHQNSARLSGISGLSEVAKKFEGLQVEAKGVNKDEVYMSFMQSSLCIDKMEITSRTTTQELKNAVCSLHGLEPEFYDVRLSKFGGLLKSGSVVAPFILGKTCSVLSDKVAQLSVWPTVLDCSSLKYTRSIEALSTYCDAVDHDKLLYLNGDGKVFENFDGPITSHSSASMGDIANIGVVEEYTLNVNSPIRRNSIFNREVMCLSSELNLKKKSSYTCLADAVDPKVIAYCLTLTDFRDFQKITPQYLALPKEAMSKKAGYMYIRMIERRFEKVVKWFTSLILDNAKTEDRLKAIEKLILVGDECFKLRNFHGCIEVITTLTSAPIKRLQDTWYHIDPKYNSIVEKLEGLILPNNNRIRYRSVLRNLRKPCLPYLGVYMSDLLFIDSGNPSVVKDPSSGLEHVNMAKFERLSKIFREIRSFQSTPYVGLEDVIYKQAYQVDDITSCESPISRRELHEEKEAVLHMAFLDEICCLDSDAAYSKSVLLEPLQRRAIHQRKRIIRSTRTYTF